MITEVSLKKWKSKAKKSGGASQTGLRQLTPTERAYMGLTALAAREKEEEASKVKA